MELELRHLRVVSTIAESGSVTKAAAELGVAQPALTAQLNRIERTLGGALFERDHRGVRPTALGELVIGRARILLPAMSGLMDDATRLSDAARGGEAPEHLTIGASTSAILAPLIQRLAEWREDLQVSTTASWSADELVGQLVENRLDFALVGLCSGSPAPRETGLTWRTFSVDPVFVLLPQDHPLAGRQEVALHELADADWAATPGDGCFHECFAAACAREEFTPKSLYVADAASCIDLVESGTAVALCQAARMVPGLVTVPLSDVPLQWNHLVGWRSDSPAAEHAGEVLATVMQAHRDLVQRSPVYSTWLQSHHGFGLQQDPGITPAV
ncbi:LysR family transcriptional regulator [Aeromicrobium sp. CTD01-1L150]|uniref:LysR family transcriptional regulator n=1 Tax=Aeromicrobium sp. CTD01-1L150 TaxID=3341830 RepID=UPI0035C1537F